MDTLMDILPAAERLPLRLRALYERYGYTRYRMGKFEPYDMYAENRSFLKSEGIISFTNAQGRLMALKPDVTLGIVKNAKQGGGPQKLYYNENVFRIEHRGEEYREISQMGLEYLGAGPGYAEAEVVSLAVSSLDAIGGDYALDVSHMGFIAGLLSAAGLEGAAGDRVLAELRRKNVDGLRALCGELGVFGAGERALTGAARLCGELGGAIAQARELVLCREMSEALDELEALYAVLSAMGKAERVYLDFSVINDLDYYNGLVFRGYVRSAKRAVLAGGRYDNLMRRFGKDQPAVGFALYLSELERLLHCPPEYDVDVLLICGDAPAEKVAAAVERLQRTGSVRAERTAPPDVKARRVMVLGEEAQTDA